MLGWKSYRVHFICRGGGGGALKEITERQTNPSRITKNTQWNISLCPSRKSVDAFKIFESLAIGCSIFANECPLLTSLLIFSYLLVD